MLEKFLETLGTLFVIIDPPGVLPIFLALTQKKSSSEKRRIALKASLIAAVILMAFTAIGGTVIKHLKISEPAFQIAGSILLFVIGLKIVFATDNTINMAPKDDSKNATDVAVFPLAVPFLAGPGSLIAVVLLQRKVAGNIWLEFNIFAAIIIVSLVTYLGLLLAAPINRLLGTTGIDVLARIFGIILTALAIQFIINSLNALTLLPILKTNLV